MIDISIPVADRPKGTFTGTAMCYVRDDGVGYRIRIMKDPDGEEYYEMPAGFCKQAVDGLIEFIYPNGHLTMYYNEHAKSPNKRP